MAKCDHCGEMPARYCEACHAAEMAALTVENAQLRDRIAKMQRRLDGIHDDLDMLNRALDSHSAPLPETDYQTWRKKVNKALYDKFINDQTGINTVPMGATAIDAGTMPEQGGEQ